MIAGIQDSGICMLLHAELGKLLYDSNILHIILVTLTKKVT